MNPRAIVLLEVCPGNAATAESPADRENLVYVADSERGEAEREDQVFEGGSEVLPEGGVWTRIVGGEEQGEHVDETETAGGSDQNAQNEGEADSKFAVGDEEGDRRGVGQNEILQHGNHKRVSSAVLQKLANPMLKTTSYGELCAEDFVFAEDQKQNADGDAESGENIRVATARRTFRRQKELIGQGSHLGGVEAYQKWESLRSRGG